MAAVLVLLVVLVLMGQQTQAAVAGQLVTVALVALVVQALLLFGIQALSVAQVVLLFLPAAIPTTHLQRPARIQHKENLNGTFCKSG